MARSMLLLLLAMAWALTAGCAVFKEENRRTLNALDEHLTPSSVGARWVFAPLALPIGLAGGATDLVLVHPACVIDDAWGDTVELLWTPRGESRFRRAVMLPLVTLATPFVFIGDWLGRAAFMLPPRKESGSEPRAPS